MIADGTNQRFEHTVRTTASPAAVWRVWTDVAGWPRWDTELAWARLDGAFAEGARGILKPKSGPEAAFRLEGVRPEETYTLRIGLPGAALAIERRQRPGAFSHVVSFTGMAAPMFAGMMGPGYRRALPGAMERIRQLAEAGR